MNTPSSENETVQKSNYVPFFLLVLIAVIFLIATAKPAGYCKAQKREIPDEEICIKLFDNAISYGLVKLQPHESSGQTYFLNHRSACSVDKSAMTRFHRYGLLDAMFSDTIQASINYQMTEKAKKNRAVTNDAPWSDLLDLSPCGEVRKASGIAF
ncbi:MAG: hypothetical protein V4454_21015 [Pseudomonadota bacterium]